MPKSDKLGKDPNDKSAPTSNGPPRTRRRFYAPKLTNRGPAGLLRKLKKTDVPVVKDESILRVNVVDYTTAKIDNIAEPYLHLAVDINSLNLDPDNARVHPERNMESIKQSLAAYGQLKPVVVRREGMIVVAGNGTLQAARALGWTKIAAAIIDMSAVHAAGYGLADNRTAELADWNWEVVARLDKLIHEQEGVTIGWTSDELEVLRVAEWQPPEITDEDEDAYPTDGKRVLKLTEEQGVVIDEVVETLKARADGPKGIKDWSNEDCVIYVLREWLGNGDTEPEPNEEEDFSAEE